MSRHSSSTSIQGLQLHPVPESASLLEFVVRGATSGHRYAMVLVDMGHVADVTSLIGATRRCTPIRTRRSRTAGAERTRFESHLSDWSSCCDEPPHRRQIVPDGPRCTNIFGRWILTLQPERTRSAQRAARSEHCCSRLVNVRSSTPPNWACAPGSIDVIVGIEHGTHTATREELERLGIALDIDFPIGKSSAA